MIHKMQLKFIFIKLLTVVFVSFNVCVAKFACSMLNDCCLKLSNWFSYLKYTKANVHGLLRTVAHAFSNKRPSSQPSTKRFLIFGHILVLKVS